MRRIMPVFICITLFLISCSITSGHGASQSNAFQSLLSITKNEQRIEPQVMPFKRMNTLSANNAIPIVLVHGLAGWGKNEMLGFRYWGGLTDIESDLEKNNHTVYTATLGTISSNWDRAIELYAQIKGSRADYGKVHSEKHHHARFGRTYSGFFPQWGEQNKIHLLSHSMGGLTARVLDQLLLEGDAQEREGTPPDELSPLFDTTPKHWVKSITTIASPHNGSSFFYNIYPYIPFIKKLIALASSAKHSENNPIYDFKLDQWELQRKPNEKFPQYSDRVGTLFHRTTDLSDYDLSPEGARDLNKWVKIHNDKYYFSISSEQTIRNPLTGHYLPTFFMNPLFFFPSIHIGSYTQSGADQVPITHRWWENDGLVSTNTMSHPITDPVIEWNVQNTPQTGIWNHLGTMHSFDHLDLIGIGIRDMRPWYRNIANFLQSLPSDKPIHHPVKNTIRSRILPIPNGT